MKDPYIIRERYDARARETFRVEARSFIQPKPFHPAGMRGTMILETTEECVRLLKTGFAGRDIFLSAEGECADRKHISK